ncbi:putative ribonuclease H [Halenospora varia]|nr:putative ribonuclease H [Halenospora varia]
MASASKKRKLNDGTTASKFYGVKAGKIPGVYQTWAECQDMITGFRGAVYKSFPTQSEASDFVAGKVVAGSIKGDKYYGVAVGHKTGVFRDWGEVQELIQGVKGPKYKKFATRAEAEEFVRSGGQIPKAPVREEGEPSAKKVKTGKARSGVLKVWTDGSSRGNGRKGALAGVGVWFGAGDGRNVSEPLVGPQQTNQRAELTAIQRALEGVDIKQNLEIITDSNYAINCSTVWYKNWERNDWRTSDNKAVTNKDLVVEIRKLLTSREAKGADTEFTWIKGHDNDPGNEAADRLAVAGALMSRD